MTSTGKENEMVLDGGSVLNLHGAQLGGSTAALNGTSSSPVHENKKEQIKDKQLHQVMRFLDMAKFSIEMSTKTLDHLDRLKDELCLDVAI